jgi:hypothetical protein
MLNGNGCQAKRYDAFHTAMQENHIPVRNEYLICGEVQIFGRIRSLSAACSASSPKSAMSSNYKLLLGMREIENAVFSLS